MLREPNTANKTRESGGIGRRARLRGVWSDSYGFKSRLSHHERTGSYEPVFSCPKTGLEPKAGALKKQPGGLFLATGAATAARSNFAKQNCVKSRLSHPSAKHLLFCDRRCGFAERKRFVDGGDENARAGKRRRELRFEGGMDFHAGRSGNVFANANAFSTTRSEL